MNTKGTGQDVEVERIADWLAEKSRVPSIGTAIRSAFDFVIDGARTRRFSIDELETSEKIYIGNRVEHAILHELDLPKCPPLDTKILGLPIDIKFSLSESWMIPPEAYQARALCIIVTAQDAESIFRVGVFRADKKWLSDGGNRDGKKGLSRAGKGSIRWIGEQHPLPINFLLHLSPADRDRVFSAVSGQAAVTQLFRVAIGKPVPRVAIETVAMQLDPVKRARDARKQLEPEGIAIYSARYDNDVLKKLGFLNLPLDSFVSVKH